MQVPDGETTSEEVLCGMVQRMKTPWVLGHVPPERLRP